MALHLNLLHDEILEQRQRQRDPLKIGILMLLSCGAILFLYYAWNAYQTFEIKAKLSAIDGDWKKLEPQVTQAQKRSAALTDIINTTRVLDDYDRWRGRGARATIRSGGSAPDVARTARQELSRCESGI